MYAGWAAAESARQGKGPEQTSPGPLSPSPPYGLLDSPQAREERTCFLPQAGPGQARRLRGGGDLGCVLSALDLSRAGCVWEGGVLEAEGLPVQKHCDVEAKLWFLVPERL